MNILISLLIAFLVYILAKLLLGLIGLAAETVFVVAMALAVVAFLIRMSGRSL